MGIFRKLSASLPSRISDAACVFLPPIAGSGGTGMTKPPKRGTNRMTATVCRSMHSAFIHIAYGRLDGGRSRDEQGPSERRLALHHHIVEKGVSICITPQNWPTEQCGIGDGGSEHHARGERHEHARLPPPATEQRGIGGRLAPAHPRSSGLPPSSVASAAAAASPP